MEIELDSSSKLNNLEPLFYGRSNKKLQNSNNWFILSYNLSNFRDIILFHLSSFTNGKIQFKNQWSEL